MIDGSKFSKSTSEGLGRVVGITEHYMDLGFMDKDTKSSSMVFRDCSKGSSWRRISGSD